MSDRVVLVTGAGGFVGRWLTPVLRGAGHRVVGLDKPGLAITDPGIEWHEVELTDPDATRRAIQHLEPQWVVHLAALSSPLEADRAPLEALRVNYLAIDGLLAALAAHVPRARLLYVGTGEVYGLRPRAAAAVDETTGLAPRNTYAATKAAAEIRARLAMDRDGLDVVFARPFNHTGPGRQAGYAESEFSRQLALAERGPGRQPLRVGNLESVRDYSDVRDVVRAYVLLLERGERGGVYNVCSGRGRSIRDLLDGLLALSPKAPPIEVDPALFRPTSPDACALVGDPSRLRALGWQPRYEFEDTLKDLLEDWRKRA